ncbi:glycosyltransferase [Paraglaciecola sp. 2405UD69-4]|uniref:glycosyltransferase n=1 Tax=Paraglaciecola sp. 2405UD69-4 TaxID=3391836 RepID=UPI0039C8D8A9
MTRSYSLLSQIEHKHVSTTLVGMAVYSGDRVDWVSQAVESVLLQNVDFTLVVVLDGPVSSAVCKYMIELEAENSNLILIELKINSGLSCCMNLIVDLFVKKTTKYFLRMDADDISTKDRIQKQIQFLDTHPQISVLGTSLIEINEYGKTVGKRKLPTLHHEIIRILPKRCAINHPTVAIRSNVFLEGYRYDGDLQNTQDYFLWIELCAAGYKFANLSEPLLQFRRVNDFYKRRGLSKSLNEFKARFYTMKVLKRYSLGNIFYACAVLFLRLMPSKVVKLAYKVDRYFLNKSVNNE